VQWGEDLRRTSIATVLIAAVISKQVIACTLLSSALLCLKRWATCRAFQQPVLCQTGFCQMLLYACYVNVECSFFGLTSLVSMLVRCRGYSFTNFSIIFTRKGDRMIGKPHCN
jgi:hypothetical protein